MDTNLLTNINIYNVFLHHFKFKERLKNKGTEFKTIIIDVNESYTSKICGVCGHVNLSNSSKNFKCSSCKIEIDRDINGSRNILIKKYLKDIYNNI